MVAKRTRVINATTKQCQYNCKKIAPPTHTHTHTYFEQLSSLGLMVFGSLDYFFFGRSDLFRATWFHKAGHQAWSHTWSLMVAHAALFVVHVGHLALSLVQLPRPSHIGYCPLTRSGGCLPSITASSEGLEYTFSFAPTIRVCAFEVMKDSWFFLW